MRKNNRKSQSNPNTRLPHLTSNPCSTDLRATPTKPGRVPPPRRRVGAQPVGLVHSNRVRVHRPGILNIGSTKTKIHTKTNKRTRNGITPRGRSWPSEHPTQAQILAEQQAASVREADTSRQLQSSNEALVRQLGGIPNNECDHECFSGKVNLTQLFHLTEIPEYQAQSEQFDNWRLLL